MTDHPWKNDEQTESLLARMPLRHPPPSLDARISGTLRSSASRPRTRAWRAAAAGIAVASAVAAGALWNRGKPPVVPRQQPSGIASSVPATAPDMASSVRTISASQTIARVVNDGVIGTWDDAPLQRVRRISLRQLVVVDPSTGQRLSVSIPHEEIVVTRAESF